MDLKIQIRMPSSANLIEPSSPSSRTIRQADTLSFHRHGSRRGSGVFAYNRWLALQSVRTIFRTTESIRDGPSKLSKLTITAKEIGATLEQLRKLAHRSQQLEPNVEQDLWEPFEEIINRC